MSRHRQQPLQWLQLHFGPDLDLQAAQAFLLNLVADRATGRIVLETEASRFGLIWRIGTSNPRAIYRLAKTHLVGVSLQEVERQLGTATKSWMLAMTPTDRPLATADPESTTAALLGAIAVSGSARVLHQLVLGQRLLPEAVAPDVKGLSGNSGLSRVTSAVLVGNQHINSEARRAMTSKRSLPGVRVNARLLLVDPDHQYPQIQAGWLAAWRTAATPGLRFRLRAQNSNLALQARSTSGRSLTLNAAELLSVTTWPFGERSYPRLDRQDSRPLPLVGRSASEGKSLGVATHPGFVGRELTLATNDALRHMAVLGPSGVGKSTLLANLALQDIASGKSVTVIDSKGDLVDDILARIPSSQLQRTVVLDPSRSDFVVGFNPLAGTTENNRQTVVDNILHIFQMQHGSSFGPRTTDIFHASLLTVTCSNNASLIAIPGLLTNAAFRSPLVARAIRIQPALAAFWSWFEQLSDAERSHAVAPLLNKLRPLTLRENLNQTLSSTKPFDVRRVFSERLVLLVPLRKGTLGPETANLFGAMVLASLWQAVQARSALSSGRRHPSFMYLDEFQDYASFANGGALADQLAQARGLGVGVVLAHQHLAQLNSDLRSAVAANAQSKVFFRLGPDDAAAIARHQADLRPTDLTRLPAFQAYAQVLRNAELLPFASIGTRPLQAPLRNPQLAATELARRWGQPPLPTAAQAPSEAQSDSTVSEASQKAEAVVEGSPTVGRRRKGRS